MCKYTIYISLYISSHHEHKSVNLNFINMITKTHDNGNIFSPERLDTELQSYGDQQTIGSHEYMHDSKLDMFVFGITCKYRIPPPPMGFPLLDVWIATRGIVIF